MSSDIVLLVEPKPASKIDPYCSENLGLPEVEKGMDRAAIAAKAPSLAQIMAIAQADAAAGLFEEMLESLDQVYPDPMKREEARRDILRKMRKKSKRPAWSTPAQTAEIRQGLARLLGAVEASAETFSVYGDQAREAVLFDLRALLAALEAAEQAGAGVRFEL